MLTYGDVLFENVFNIKKILTLHLEAKKQG